MKDYIGDGSTFDCSTANSHEGPEHVFREAFQLGSLL